MINTSSLGWPSHRSISPASTPQMASSQHSPGNTSTVSLPIISLSCPLVSQSIKYQRPKLFVNISQFSQGYFPISIRHEQKMETYPSEFYIESYPRNTCLISTLTAFQ